MAGTVRTLMGERTVREVMAERSLTSLRGRIVHLPDGRRLGMVHDAVVDAQNWECSHLFVRDTDPKIVEGGLHLAVPWRWVRSVSDIVLLRWFPPTPLPRDPQA